MNIDTVMSMMITVLHKKILNNVGINELKFDECFLHAKENSHLSMIFIHKMTVVYLTVSLYNRFKTLRKLTHSIIMHLHTHNMQKC